LASILKLFSGWFSDKINRRKLPAVLGYVLSVGIRPFLAVVANFWQVFGLRLVDRVGKGFRDAPRDALISESTPKEELGKAFGYHRMMDTFGATIGPLSAFLILPFLNNDYRSLFLIAFAIGIFSILSFFFVKEVKRPEGTTLPKFNFSLFKENKRFTLFVAAIFIFGLGALPVPLLLLRSPEIGLGIGTVPLFYFVYSLSFVLFSMPLGKLSDRIGQRKVIIFGFFAALVAYLGLAFSGGFIMLGLMFLVLGFYGAATDGIGRALAAKLIDPQLLATGQGFLNAATGLSALLAGVVGGALWNFLNSQAAFIYAAAASFVGLIFFLKLTQKHEYENS
jgi:MFS family permease